MLSEAAIPDRVSSLEDSIRVREGEKGIVLHRLLVDEEKPRAIFVGFRLLLCFRSHVVKLSGCIILVLTKRRPSRTFLITPIVNVSVVQTGAIV